jgi:ankyrin repeat protein
MGLVELIDRIRDGRCDLVFDLAAKGSSAAARDSSGVPVIRWCAYYGDVSAIRHLLAEGETLDSLGPNLDLNGAAFHGHWQLCQFLIENGADPNHRLPDTGETPLHAALSRANQLTAEHVLAVLLDAGADTGVAAGVGAETGCFMRDVRTRGEFPLHRAAAFGSEATIGRLIEAGASPAVTDAHGDTPADLGQPAPAPRGDHPPALLRRLVDPSRGGLDGRSRCRLERHGPAPHRAATSGERVREQPCRRMSP